MVMIVLVVSCIYLINAKALIVIINCVFKDDNSAIELTTR
jgi:hypothetical protein